MLNNEQRFEIGRYYRFNDVVKLTISGLVSRIEYDRHTKCTVLEFDAENGTYKVEPHEQPKTQFWVNSKTLSGNMPQPDYVAIHGGIIHRCFYMTEHRTSQPIIRSMYYNRYRNADIIHDPSNNQWRIIVGESLGDFYTCEPELNKWLKNYEETKKDGGEPVKIPTIYIEFKRPPHETALDWTAGITVELTE